MRIFLTGASSFTGAWFAKSLSEAGHDVIAPLRRARAAYHGLKAQRLAWIEDCCELVENAPFGSDAFLARIESDRFNILCHHAAEVTNYRSPDFDVLGALAANTYRIREVTAAVGRSGCDRILLTGTVFEPGEGAGDAPLRAFNAYGLSKNLTAQLFDFYAGEIGLGKFIIANPFGPYEEARLTDYLLRQWQQRKTAMIQAPAYIRDYIPVPAMAEAYVQFAEKLSRGQRTKTAPSCYAESQADFALRFAREMGARLDLSTPLEFASQIVFDEPLVRVGTDPVPSGGLGAAWDGLACYYSHVFEIGHRL